MISWESGACINYLLRVYDKDNKLGPKDNTEQARVDFDKWIFFLVSSLGPMQGQGKSPHYLLIDSSFGKC